MYRLISNSLFKLVLLQSIEYCHAFGWIISVAACVYLMKKEKRGFGLFFYSEQWFFLFSYLCVHLFDPCLSLVFIEINKFKTETMIYRKCLSLNGLSDVERTSVQVLRNINLEKYQGIIRNLPHSMFMFQIKINEERSVVKNNYCGLERISLHLFQSRIFIC